MPFQVTVTRFPEYVRYDAAGRTSLKRFVGLVTGVAADTEQFEDDRVLVDLRGVEGRLTAKEQVLVGEVVAMKLPLLFKLASVVPEGEITRNSESAALFKGLQIRVFDSVPVALSWLLEGKPN
ncbi:MAG: hypothetical protein JWQ33_197 [Ramlibacter sp.]|nr:hypothetical protein [Ramlibacter sp.]